MTTAIEPLIVGYYLRNCFDTHKLRQYIALTVKKLRPHAKKFDSIAFRGMSGSLVAPAVAAKLRKHLIMVRKNDQNHSGATVEGYGLSKAYIIIDDFVDSGATVATIIKEIRRWQEHEVVRYVNEADHGEFSYAKFIGGAFYLQEENTQFYREDAFRIATHDVNRELLYIPCLPERTF